MKVKRASEVTQSCLTLRDPMDCSLPGSSFHGIFQVRVLEWVAIAFSKGNAKGCLNFFTSALISHASKVMLKILQARPHEYVIQELPDVQDGFRKGRGTRDQIANIHCIIEKAKDFKKTSTSTSLTRVKPLSVWITTNGGRFLKRWDCQTT